MRPDAPVRGRADAEDDGARGIVAACEAGGVLKAESRACWIGGVRIPALIRGTGSTVSSTISSNRFREVIPRPLSAGVSPAADDPLSIPVSASNERSFRAHFISGLETWDGIRRK
jgi:hypothetical protein